MKAALVLLGGLSVLVACKGTNPAPTPTPAPPLPVLGANFTLPATIEAFTPALFHNTSQNAARYKWDFGDGSTSTQADPTHTYTKVGTYTVTLRAYDVKPDSASISKTCLVQINANDLFVAAPMKILGNYDYKLLTVFSSIATYPFTAQSTGILTVTQTGASTLAISKVSATTSFTYDPDPANPTIYRFRYHDDATSALITTFGSALFYPTGDSMHIDLTTYIGAGSTQYDTYRCYRRP